MTKTWLVLKHWQDSRLLRQLGLNQTQYLVTSTRSGERARRLGNSTIIISVCLGLVCMLATSERVIWIMSEFLGQDIWSTRTRHQKPKIYSRDGYLIGTHLVNATRDSRGLLLLIYSVAIFFNTFIVVQFIYALMFYLQLLSPLIQRVPICFRYIVRCMKGNVHAPKSNNYFYDVLWVKFLILWLRNAHQSLMASILIDLQIVWFRVGSIRKQFSWLWWLSGKLKSCQQIVDDVLVYELYSVLNVRGTGRSAVAILYKPAQSRRKKKNLWNKNHFNGVPLWSVQTTQAAHFRFLNKQVPHNTWNPAGPNRNRHNLGSLHHHICYSNPLSARSLFFFIVPQEFMAGCRVSIGLTTSGQRNWHGDIGSEVRQFCSRSPSVHASDCSVSSLHCGVILLIGLH